MKLKSCATYQYVRFQNKNENWLQKSPTMPDLELELVTVGNTAVIKATTSKDSILIFPTNISYAVQDTSEPVKAVKKA